MFVCLHSALFPKFWNVPKVGDPCEASSKATHLGISKIWNLRFKIFWALLTSNFLEHFPKFSSTSDFFGTSITSNFFDVMNLDKSACKKFPLKPRSLPDAQCEVLRSEHCQRPHQIHVTALPSALRLLMIIELARGHEVDDIGSSTCSHNGFGCFTGTYAYKGFGCFADLFQRQTLWPPGQPFICICSSLP